MIYTHVKIRFIYHIGGLSHVCGIVSAIRLALARMPSTLVLNERIFIKKIQWSRHHDISLIWEEVIKYAQTCVNWANGSLMIVANQDSSVLATTRSLERVKYNYVVSP